MIRKHACTADSLPRLSLFSIMTAPMTTGGAMIGFIVGALFSVSAQATLPVPVAVLEADEETASTLNHETLTRNTELSTSDNDRQSIKSTAAASMLASWREQAQADNLAQHTTWRRLLYFLDDNKNIFTKGKNKSLVSDSAFFLSTEGQYDSAAELDAMLVALSQALSQSHISSDSVLCRYPARVSFLAEALGIEHPNLKASCSELDEWMEMLAPEQLSIMFGQEYLDNPISAFAHTLLRIDSKASLADPSQIHHAYALNDTVDGNPDDNFLIFAIKAASGGYDNRIEIDPYPEKWANYLKKDERDTWTYQLDLTPAEVQQIMRHVWETKDLHIPYYFATDNCASEILRLIDVVRPQQRLLSQLPYAVIPSDVIQLLDNESLLTSTLYTPSDGTLRQAQLNKANEALQLGYATFTQDDINGIKSEQANVVSSISADKQRLVSFDIEASDNNPIDRQPLQRGHLGVGRQGDNSYIELGLRAGYHSMLDRPSGFPQFLDLEGAAATLRLYDTDSAKPNQPKSVVLQNATLIRGRSFNPVNSAKKGQTWGLSVEATRINDGSQPEGGSHLVASTALEYGKSWVFGTPTTDTGEMPPQLCYTFATGAVQGGRGINKGFRIGAGVNAGCRYQINNRLRAQAELQLPYWYHGSSDQQGVQSGYWQPISTIGLQYDIDRKQALRINASYEWQDRIVANDDVKLSYMRYF